MKYLLASLFFISLCFFGIAQDGETIDIKGLNQNPGNLKGSVYIPNKLKNNSRKKPLLVLLHGCNQSPKQMLSITGFQKYADSLGFYILMPEQKMINNPNRCFNWFYEKDISHQEEGESRSIISMIDYVEGNYPIDTYSVHAVGLSAGAAMANALLFHYPKVFNSGAVIAGGPVGVATNAVDAAKVLGGKVTKSIEDYASNTNHFKTVRRIPRIMLVHGLSDVVVDPINLLEATKQWKAILKDDIDDSVYNSKFLDADQVATTIYIDSLGHELLKTTEIKNLGHKYPQKRGDCFGESGEDGLHAEDIGYNLTLDIIHYFGLNKRRIRPNRTSEPSWEHKYVSLKRYCDNSYYELETSLDTCSNQRFVNYSISEMNGCSVSDYYYIYR